jgi:phytoene desaturase
MFVLVPTPLLSQMPGTDWETTTGDVKARVLARLGHHDVKLDPSAIEVEQVMTPVEWCRRFGLYDGSAFGAAHTLFQLGPMRSSNYSKEIKGLYYVGASTTPGTGLPMVVLGGKMIAERIQKTEVRKQKSEAGSQKPESFASPQDNLRAENE